MRGALRYRWHRRSSTSLLAKKHPTRVECIGVNDEFGHSGKAEDLLKQFGLTAENIVKTAKKLCAE